MLARLMLVAAAAAAAAQQPAPPPPEQQRDLKFTREPAAPVVKPGERVVIPRSYALVIGISGYPKLPPQGQLRFPARDAAAIYAALISPEGGQFPPENVRRLIGRDATLANIREALEKWLPSVSKDEDRVVIYFAGHGFVSGGRAFLAPYDIDPADIPGTAYPMERLGRVIGSEIRAKWKVLLTDSCHSGAITPEADARRINASLLELDRSLFSLTASRDREQSFESEIWGGGHGVFTYYLIKGIEGEADENADGVVTADELGAAVRGCVRGDTQARRNPTAGRGSGE
ncbi:MAG: caspase family protein, partial [Bryobacteraceae bacterium]